MTDQVPSKDLLPCPFCGKAAKVYGVNLVGCVDTVGCGAQVDWGHFYGPDAVIAAWNKRAAPEPAAEWQPIETAPKDGTPILGLVMPPRMQASLEGPRVVKWVGEYGMWSMPGISGLTCSHWMPLPKAPSQPPRDGQ